MTVPATPQVVQVEATASQRGKILHSVTHSWMGRVGLAIVFLMVVVIVFGPALAPNASDNANHTLLGL